MKKLPIICALFFIGTPNITSGCLGWFSNCIGECKKVKDLCQSEDSEKVTVNIINNANNDNNNNNTTEHLTKKHDKSPNPRNSITTESSITDETENNTHVKHQQDKDIAINSDILVLPNVFHGNRPKSLELSRFSHKYVLTPISVQTEQNNKHTPQEYEMITLNQDDSIRYSSPYYRDHSPAHQEYTPEEVYFLHERNIESQIRKYIYEELPEHTKEKFTPDMSIREFITLCEEKFTKFSNKANEYSLKATKDLRSKEYFNKYTEKSKKYQSILNQCENIQLLFEKFSDNPIVFKTDRTQNHKEIQLIQESTMHKYIAIAMKKSYHEFQSIVKNLETLHVVFHMNPPEELINLATEQSGRQFEKSIKKFINIKNNYCSQVSNDYV